MTRRQWDPVGDVLRMRLARAHQECADWARRAGHLAEQAEQYQLAAIAAHAASAAAELAARLQAELREREAAR